MHCFIAASPPFGRDTIHILTQLTTPVHIDSTDISYDKSNKSAHEKTAVVKIKSDKSPYLMEQGGGGGSITYRRLKRRRKTILSTGLSSFCLSLTEFLNSYSNKPALLWDSFPRSGLNSRTKPRRKPHKNPPIFEKLLTYGSRPRTKFITEMTENMRRASVCNKASQELYSLYLVVKGRAHEYGKKCKEPF